ncbi:MAG: class I SAM-dependent methyltransferase [Thermodesulfobacteriota bacterium]
MTFKRLKLYASMLRFGLTHNQDFALEHYGFFAGMLERLRKLDKDPRGRRVLDVGCGKTFWLSLLLSNFGAEVTGFDVEPVSTGRRLTNFIDIGRRQGLERAVRTAAWALLLARPYYRGLERLAGRKLSFDGLDLRTMSAGALDFEAGVFDLAVSFEVFEHLPDVPAALGEIRRVLKPDGLTYIYVHNYTSLSGGHHIAWKYPDLEPSKTVPAWDHLRQNLFPDVPSWINRLRMSDFRRLFEAEFEILEWAPNGPEGAALLTAEIKAELAGYSEEELLTKGFTVIARPR